MRLRTLAVPVTAGAAAIAVLVYAEKQPPTVSGAPSVTPGATISSAAPSSASLTPTPAKTSASVSASPPASRPTTVNAVPVPKVIFAGDNTRPQVALTFDTNLTANMVSRLDANPRLDFNNLAVLDELDKANVPATFFLAGMWIEQYHHTAARIAANPNFDVGSHSYQQRGFGMRCYGLGVLPSSDMVSDIAHAERIITSLHPVHQTNYFRFPGGCYTPAAVEAAIEAGVQPVEFSLVSGDAFEPRVSFIVNRVMSQVTNGSIIAMTLTKANAPATALALPRIIRQLKARGFQLVRLSQLLAAGNVVYGPSSAGPS